MQVDSDSVSTSNLPRGFSPESLLRNGRGTILIIGPPDSGKSTLADALVATARANHLSVARIDADLGQNRLGLPACIWGANEADTVLCGAFLGSLAPAGHEVQFVDALVQLRTILSLAGAKILIIDTPGFTFGAQTCDFQRRLLSATLPDHLLVLERGVSLSPLLDALHYPSAIRLPRLPGCRDRSAQQRKQRRQSLMSRHFDGAEVVTVPIERHTCWMRGVPIRPDGRLVGHIAAFSQSRIPTVVQIMAVRQDSLEMDLLVHPAQSMEGPFLVGSLVRSSDGSLRHEPNLADPSNIPFQTDRI